MGAHAGIRSLRVLHVDDDGVNRLVMDHMLASLGHHPQPAETAAEALAWLDREAFDVVLTDIHMPAPDGVAFLQRLRAEGRQDLPVIAVTADVMSRTADDYRGIGFAAAIAKPLKFEGLQAALTDAARPPAERRFAAFGLARG